MIISEFCFFFSMSCAIIKFYSIISKSVSSQFETIFLDLWYHKLNLIKIQAIKYPPESLDILKILGSSTVMSLCDSLCINSL